MKKKTTKTKVMGAITAGYRRAGDCPADFVEPGRLRRQLRGDRA